ncbi:MAG: spermidine/putrescine ABC transporter substrate-binding protein [Alphaproteobacteria bacterium]
MNKQDFLHHLRRYQRGSISRRHFLGSTGLGLATAVLANELGLRPRPAFAGDIGDRVSLCTWPSYHDPANLEAFTKETGATVEQTVFGSNEEMMAKLQAGAAGYDVLVPTNYTIRDYATQALIQPLDLAQLPAHDPSAHDTRFTGEGSVDGTIYAVPKDWGTTGFVIESSVVTENPTTWKDFWDLTQGAHSGKVMVHDYQLTTIGNALKYYGYSFNSIDPAELADAEKLLLAAKPHLFGINSDYKPSLLSGDAVMSICWTGDAVQLRRENAAMQYVIGREGGEIWTDFYAIPSEAPNVKGAYALINYLLTPEVNAKEVLFHGYPSTDARTNALLPKELLEDPVLYPAAELLAPLEFGATGLITNEARAELFARFKSA